MHYTQDPLWQKIEAYTLDDEHTAYPFSSKLASEQNWTWALTIRAIEEYKKFIYLCCIMPQGASPPKIVDEVWHLHLTYTKDYWRRFCRDTLERDIHHTPSAGGDDKAKYQTLYIQTLLYYSKTFGHAPPQDIWPIVTATEPYSIPQQHFFEAGPRQRFLLLLLPFLLIFLFYNTLFPYHLNGPHFLVFYCLLAASAGIANTYSINARQKRLEQLPDLLSADKNKYELAFLAGGDNRLLQMCLTDLISREYLIFNGVYSYRTNLTDNDVNDNPLYPYLQQHADTDSIPLDTLAKHRPEICEAMYRKYQPLINAYGSARNNILLPALVMLVGIIRCMQGIDNDEPITILIMLMLGFLLFALSIMIHTSNMHSVIEKKLMQTPEYVTQVSDSVSHRLLIYGIDGIASIMTLHYLSDQYKYRTNNSWSDDGSSSCSSGGCSSGCGSCGGGCGGCGGS